MGSAAQPVTAALNEQQQKMEDFLAMISKVDLWPPHAHAHPSHSYVPQSADISLYVHTQLALSWVGWGLVIVVSSLGKILILPFLYNTGL